MEKQGLGDAQPQASDAEIGPDGGEGVPTPGDESGDTTVSRCSSPPTLPVVDAEKARSRRVPTVPTGNAEDAHSRRVPTVPMENAEEGSSRRDPGPPGKCKCAAKRDRILRAATELFATHAFHRVLMEDVANHAEVGKGTLYRYFETKEDLFVAALSHAVDVTTERLRARLEKLDDPVKQLRLACVQALRFFRENDHLFHVLHHRKALGSEEQRAELAEKRRGLRHFAESIIEEGRQSGVFDVEDPGFASTILWGMIRTALRTAPADMDFDELGGKIIALFTNGITAR